MLCVAACGGGAERRASPQPKLPRPVAVVLAQSSDAVADALEAGDDCGALTLAQALQRRTIAEINAGRVPGPLQEPLQTTVNDLAGRIQCVAPPAEDDEQRGRGKGKGKGKKHGEGDD